MKNTAATQSNQYKTDAQTVGPKVIEVVIEPQYGKWVYYPACDGAKAFAAIAGTKTLTEPVLAQIKKLGYEIKASAKSLPDLIGSMTNKGRDHEADYILHKANWENR